MYSSNSTDDQKYGIPPPPSAAATAPPDGKPAIGISEGFMNQQPPIQPQPKTRALWSTSLFGCFEDVPNCCMTFWCPCITFGQIAEIVDKGSTSCGASGAIYTLMALFLGCPWLYSCTYRSKMRDQYMLPESPCCDCLVHCFCETCALCQEYRERQNRGFNMSVGWHKNVERQNGEMAMAPVVLQGMSR